MSHKSLLLLFAFISFSNIHSATQLWGDLRCSTGSARIGRAEEFELVLGNPGEGQESVNVMLLLPPHTGLNPDTPAQVTINRWSKIPIYTTQINDFFKPQKLYSGAPLNFVKWKIWAHKPGLYEIKVRIYGTQVVSQEITLPVEFRESLQGLPYRVVPAPVAAATLYTLGANYYPGWKPGTGTGFSIFDDAPWKKPELGYYSEGNADIVDWEIKWALEHGIKFFNYCWYRDWMVDVQGKVVASVPVKPYLGDALHSAIYLSKYMNQFNFTINYSGGAPAHSKQDLVNNVFPYWIETYFKHPRYLQKWGRPILFIYEWENLTNQIGGMVEMADAIHELRRQVVSAGFPGIYIVGNYRYRSATTSAVMKSIGFDYTYAYNYNTLSPKSNQAAVDEVIQQQQLILDDQVLPVIPTISVGWNPEQLIRYNGYPYNPIPWTLNPEYFTQMAEKVKQQMSSIPYTLGNEFALIDSWNEWGEGHAVSPYRLYGFSYLDSIRKVFTSARRPENMTPRDVGISLRESYETEYYDWKVEMQKRLGF